MFRTRFSAFFCPSSGALLAARGGVAQSHTVSMLLRAALPAASSCIPNPGKKRRGRQRRSGQKNGAEYGKLRARQAVLPSACHADCGGGSYTSSTLPRLLHSQNPASIRNPGKKDAAGGRRSGQNGVWSGKYQPACGGKSLSANACLRERSNGLDRFLPASAYCEAVVERRPSLFNESAHEVNLFHGRRKKEAGESARAFPRGAGRGATSP